MGRRPDKLAADYAARWLAAAREAVVRSVVCERRLSPAIAGIHLSWMIRT